MDFTEACRTYERKDAERFDEASEAVVDFVLSQEDSLSVEDITRLTHALANSGSTIEIPSDLYPLADVPSTGGPASLSTLLCPLLIAGLGVRVPKLSASGSIAGAIDTMGTIPGFRMELQEGEFVQVLGKAGIAHIVTTPSLCPGDTSLVRCRRERGLMKSASLAAASLLAKKAAVPETSASFDFRVGRTGNIGDDEPEARAAAEVFFEVAERLGIRIDITLTDNSSFPCSAVGRLESLSLLWRIANGAGDLLELDRQHVHTCIELAAKAVALARCDMTAGKAEERLRELAESQGLVDVLRRHLEAQGSSLAGIQKVLSTRDSQDVLHVRARAGGHWHPPAIGAMKVFAKGAQAAVEMDSRLRTSATESMHHQFGMRLLVSPGDYVGKDQPVLEVRYPHGFLGSVCTPIDSIVSS